MKRSRAARLSEIGADVIREYGRLGSIRATAFFLGISQNNVRKILITSGKIEYDRTQQALVLLKYGKTLSEVAHSLGISKKVLNNYLPYSRGEYKRKDKKEKNHG